MAFIGLLPLCLRAVALCVSQLFSTPRVQGIILAVQAYGLFAKSGLVATSSGYAAPPRGLTESLSEGGLIATTSLLAATAATAGQVDGRCVAQRAVAAVEIAEAATESAAEVAARAEWGALADVGFGQMGYSRPQSSWDAARHGLGLAVWEAKALSAERMLLWYWIQPIAFMWVLSQNFCGLSTELRWHVAIIGLREVTFFLATGLAALPCACPGFLLLDSRLIRPSQWPISPKDNPSPSLQHNASEIGALTEIPPRVVLKMATAEGGGGSSAGGEDGEDGTDAPHRGHDPGSQIIRATVYLLAPHHFVNLCLVRRFGKTWGIMVVMHLLADAHSLNALWLLLGEPNPSAALAVGFMLTVPMLFVWFGVVAWRIIASTIKVPERPPVGRFCVGVTGFLMMSMALGVLAIGVTALLGLGGALSPRDGVCYSALRGDACVATGEPLASGSILPERFGYACAGSSCAAQPPLGSLLSYVPCAVAAPEGYVLDAKTATCVAP
jgi:hypothetical protein